MVKKVDHITFAVKDLEVAGKRVKELYGAEFLMTVENAEGNYRCDAYIIGDLIIGLLASTSPDGFVAKHIEKFGEGLQHIGADVENLDETIKMLEAKGIKYSGYKEFHGVKKEILVGPKNGLGAGAVTQLQEWQGEYKNYGSRDRMLKAWNVF